ncbi:unnamed protein product [Paramecium octaurelia]|uniref:Uncharacterized protein n=1 Tax=Paramecium octaurelia TaxID=43137 RepID=A0A8S1SJK2_PAROT|nr:unnamed protein product [Paramecium octaurelia]
MYLQFQNYFMVKDIYSSTKVYCEKNEVKKTVSI